MKAAAELEAAEAKAAAELEAAAGLKAAAAKAAVHVGVVEEAVWEAAIVESEAAMAEALAVVNAELEAEAATEVAAAAEEEATAEVKALMQLAESCGHTITIAEAEERLSLEEDWRLWSLEEVLKSIIAVFCSSSS